MDGASLTPGQTAAQQRSVHRRRLAAVLVLVAVAGVLAAGCTDDDPVLPPVPTGFEVAETLREEGLPVYAFAERNNDRCFAEGFAPTRCVHQTVFVDERSGALPSQADGSSRERYAFGGTIEVYPDPDSALDRGIQLGRYFAPAVDSYAVYVAGPIVLELGTIFQNRMDEPYVGDDYRQALEHRYGPVTYAVFSPGDPNFTATPRPSEASPTVGTSTPSTTGPSGFTD